MMASEAKQDSYQNEKNLDNIQLSVMRNVWFNFGLHALGDLTIK